MPFDWRNFLDLAKELSTHSATDPLQEARERSAVSRAYYGAFCWARDYARESTGFQPTGDADDHTLLRQHFEKSGQTQLASRLNRLRQWRNLCDYKDEVRNLKSLAQMAIVQAQKVVEECR